MVELLGTDLALVLQGFVLLFSILNAVGNVPIFLSLTADHAEKRRTIVKQSVLVAFLILVAFAYSGWIIFQFFGITIDDFKIAGGIILFIVAYDDLKGELPRTKQIRPEEIAAFPLATPLLAGPGAISTSIILANPPYGPLAAFLLISVNCLLAWAILRESEVIRRALGENGTKVLTRIMGLIIAAVGVSFVREGLLSIFSRVL